MRCLGYLFLISLYIPQNSAFTSLFPSSSPLHTSYRSKCSSSLFSLNLAELYPEGCLPNGEDSVSWVDLYSGTSTKGVSTPTEGISLDSSVEDGKDKEQILPVFPLGEERRRWEARWTACCALDGLEAAL